MTWSFTSIFLPFFNLSMLFDTKLVLEEKCSEVPFGMSECLWLLEDFSGWADLEDLSFFRDFEAAFADSLGMIRSTPLRLLKDISLSNQRATFSHNLIRSQVRSLLARTRPRWAYQKIPLFNHPREDEVDCRDHTNKFSLFLFLGFFLSVSWANLSTSSCSF